MTTMTRPAELWNTMPGWGIAADLTPPELINSRQIKVIRRWITVIIAVAMLVCLAGFAVASRRQAAAAGALDRERAQTRSLQSQARKYDGITKIQGTVSEVQSQVAKLMGGDVDLVTLLARVRTELPRTMTIVAETVTISLSAVGSAGSTTGADISGHQIIGNISLSGNADRIVNLSAYVLRLQAIDGVVDVLPLSNAGKAGDETVHYTVTLNLTDKLLSHRFDHSISGGK
jgi:hypothetical protein